MIVLGATGHLGQAIVRQAIEDGHSVTALTRQTDPPALRGLGMTIVRVTPDLTSLVNLAAGHDLMVDAAAPYPLEQCAPRSAAWQRAVGDAVRHAETVVEAARTAGVPLVFVSSFTTLPRPEGAATTGAAWRHAVYPYFEAKHAMEQTVRSAAARGLRALIVNPGACLGPWEHRPAESSFVGLVLSGQLPAVMDCIVNVVDVRDVSLVIQRAAGAGWWGHQIPIAGHNVHLADLAEQIAGLAGLPSSRPVIVDTNLAMTGAYLANAALDVLGHAAPDPLRAAPLIAESFPMQPSLEQMALGVTARPLVTTLVDAVRFRNAGL